MNFLEYAVEVAAALGNNWHAPTPGGDSNPVNVHILGPNGASIFLSATWVWVGKNHRIYASGDFSPEHYRSGAASGAGKCSITVKAGTAAANCAKQIRQRLLPNYLEALASVVNKQATHDAHVLGTRCTATRVAAILKGSVQQVSDTTFNVYSPGHMQSISSPDSIRLEGFYVTMAQLEKILKAVPELFSQAAE